MQISEFHHIILESGNIPKILIIVLLDEVLRRANQIEQIYKDNGDNIPSDSQYHVLFNNCEHIAYYCKVGDRKSVQVKVSRG